MLPLHGSDPRPDAAEGGEVAGYVGAVGVDEGLTT